MRSEGVGWEQLHQELIAGDPHAAWFDMDQFMDHRKGTEYANDELARLFQPAVDEHFTVLDVQQVNYKPHPFTITQRHFTDSGTIDPDKAPCGYQAGQFRQMGEGCRLSHAEHTSDRVVFLQCKHDVAQSEAQACLSELKPLMEEHKCDGVAFVDHPQGFKIVTDLE
jgi:hypothetical protein